MLGRASLTPILADFLLLGTLVNRFWVFLRASPLHALNHLLGLWRELIELASLTADADGHRLTLHVLQDDRPSLESPRGGSIRPIAVLEGVYLGVGGILGDDPLELHAFDSSHGDRLRFLGFEIGVVLEPADHVLRCLHGRWGIYTLGGLIDLLEVPEDQQRISWLSTW